MNPSLKVAIYLPILPNTLQQPCKFKLVGKIFFDQKTWGNNFFFYQKIWGNNFFHKKVIRFTLVLNSSPLGKKDMNGASSNLLELVKFKNLWIKIKLKIVEKLKTNLSLASFTSASFISGLITILLSSSKPASEFNRSWLMIDR